MWMWKHEITKSADFLASKALSLQTKFKKKNNKKGKRSAKKRVSDSWKHLPGSEQEALVFYWLLFHAKVTLRLQHS